MKKNGRNIRTLSFRRKYSKKSNKKSMGGGKRSTNQRRKRKSLKQKRNRRKSNKKNQKGGVDIVLDSRIKLELDRDQSVAELKKYRSLQEKIGRFIIRDGSVGGKGEKYLLYP